MASDTEFYTGLGNGEETHQQDFVLREKIFHFDHECIPERIVHARGWAAHAGRRTDSSISQRWPEAQVRLIHRVTSEVSGEVLYQDGNWDLVGNNIAVFFIQDAIKFPDHEDGGDYADRVIVQAPLNRRCHVAKK